VNEKPDIACQFLDVVLDAEIGNTGFRCCDSSIQCSFLWSCHNL